MKKAALLLALLLALSACSPRETAPQEPAAPETPPVETPAEQSPTEPAPAQEDESPELPLSNDEAFEVIHGLRNILLDAPWEDCSALSTAEYIFWFGYGVQERDELGRYIQDDWDCARFPAKELEEAVCAAFDVTAEQLRADKELFVEDGDDSYYLLPAALTPYSQGTVELRAVDFEGDDLSLRFTAYYPNYSEPQSRQALRLLLDEDDGTWRYKALLEDTEE